jgi:hypothetical protein
MDHQGRAASPPGDEGRGNKHKRLLAANAMESGYTTGCMAGNFIRSSTMSLTTLILCQIVLKCMI